LETDLLATNKNMMIALAKLTATIIGTATMASGLACAPNSPAALNVVIAPGEIYSLQNIDGTAYSSIAADTAHSIMKQGILLDSVTLACAAPGTAGQSINYLIQAAFSEVDSGAVVLPYYNASNPSTAYSGPGGAGTTNNTVRDGTVALSAKAGIAAATGSQVTPAADAGYVGLWVVTVANGQTSITTGNVAKAAGAPFSGTAAMLNVLNAFTVSPTVPTPAPGDDSQRVASTAFVANMGKISTPPGAVAHFAVSSAPSGWMKANGALVSRTAYASLFASIGTAFGAGDGSTTFALPDLRGEFIRGFDDSKGVDAGRTIGSFQRPTAIRAILDYWPDNISGAVGAWDIDPAGGTTPQGGTSGSTLNNTAYFKSNGNIATPGTGTNDNQSFTTRPRNVALLACIKY